MTLYKSDGPYQRRLERLNHAVEPPHVWSDCAACQEIHNNPPVAEDFVYCQLCGCCGLVLWNDDDEESPSMCIGGCSLDQGKHDPIEAPS